MDRIMSPWHSVFPVFLMVRLERLVANQVFYIFMSFLSPNSWLGKMHDTGLNQLCAAAGMTVATAVTYVSEKHSRMTVCPSSWRVNDEGAHAKEA